MLFGRLLRHIVIVTANGTKQLGGEPRLPPYLDLQPRRPSPGLFTALSFRHGRRHLRLFLWASVLLLGILRALRYV
jgi:hypothetical protein